VLVRTHSYVSLALSAYSYGGGRKAQCKQSKHPLGRWPKKSAQLVYGLLKNAEANAEVKVRWMSLSDLMLRGVVGEAVKSKCLRLRVGVRLCLSELY
jgi:ribosomal protein L22